MKLKINGENRKFDQKLESIKHLLEATEIETQTGMSIAVNREVVPQSQWESRGLEHGDAIEIIRATQGG